MCPKLKRFLSMIPAYSISVALGFIGVAIFNAATSGEWWYLLIAALTAGIYIASLDYIDSLVPSSPFGHWCMIIVALWAAMVWWISIPLTLVVSILYWLIFGNRRR